MEFKKVDCSELIEQVKPMVSAIRDLSIDTKWCVEEINTYKTSTYDMVYIKDIILKLAEEKNVDEIKIVLEETLERSKKVEKFLESLQGELDKLERVRMATNNVFKLFFELRKELQTTEKLDKILELVDSKK